MRSGARFWLPFLFTGGLQHLGCWPHFRLGWLEDRVPVGPVPVGECSAEVAIVGVFGGDQHALPFGELVCERLALGGEVLDPLAHLPDFLACGEGEFVVFGFGDRLGFGGPQRLEALVGVAAAKFGVCCYGQVTLFGGGAFPGAAVLHGPGEDLLAFAVGAVHGLVAGRQCLVLGGQVVSPAAAGGVRFGVSSGGGELGFPCSGPDLAEFVADPFRCPGGFDRVGVAHVQQGAVWQV